ncbi:hypothetical protein RBI22_15265 [Alcaligenaceae bacterium C4P045]|nr:hypothetical protein [Alcaligenaceae bacterium C4P045]
MSHQAVTWALNQPVNHSPAKFVLTVMAHHVAHASARPWLVWPSITQLAESTGQDRKTVLANVKRLLERGFILDTGERTGRTKSVAVYELPEQVSSPESGTPKQSQNRDGLAVPKLAPLSSPKSGTASTPSSSPETGTASPPPEAVPVLTEAVPVFPTERFKDKDKEEGEGGDAFPAHERVPTYVHAHTRTHEADAADPTHARSVEIVVLLRKRGCNVHASIPYVRDWASRQVTDAQLLTAYDTARQRRQDASDPAPVNAGYLDSILRDVVAQASRSSAQRPQSAAQKASDWNQQLSEAIAAATGPREIDMGVIDATGQRN